MSIEMIIVSSDAINSLIAEVKGLRAEIRAAHYSPPPRWITIAEYATKICKSESTVQRHIRDGQLEVSGTGTTRMVPNPDFEKAGT